MSDSTKNIVEFSLIYNQHKTKIYNYARKMLSDRMTCEDIVQNVFVKFFQNMNLIKDAGRISVWLYTTARNEIYSFYRTKSSHVDQFGVQDVEEIDVDSSTRIEDEFELQEMKEMIMKELDKLPIEQREVFLLKEYGGFSYKEISDIMKIDEDLIKSRLYKTRQKLIYKLSKVVGY